MATFDLEEQEQISELKLWWQQYGKLAVALAVAAVVGVAGFYAWKNYQRGQAAQASMVFAVAQKAAAERDAKKAREAAGELLEKYPGTAYAAMGALVSAKIQYETGDLKTAKAQLQWVVDKAGDAELRDLARLRLAGVLFDEKAYDEALRLLAEEPLLAFAPRYAELRGDILVAQGKAAEAKGAYQAALAKLDAAEKETGRGQTSSVYREMLQAKLDSVGDK